jgi:hypothetical protein
MRTLARNKRSRLQQKPTLSASQHHLKSSALQMPAASRQAVRHIVITETRFLVSLARQTIAIPYHHLLSLLEVHIDARRSVCGVASRHPRRCPLSAASIMPILIRKPHRCLLIALTPYRPLPPQQGFRSLHITQSKCFLPPLALLLAFLAIFDWFEIHLITYVIQTIWPMASTPCSTRLPPHHWYLRLRPG